MGKMISLYESLLERMGGTEYSHYFSTWCFNDSHKTPALLVFDDGLAKCLSCNKVWTHKQLDKKIGSRFIPQKNNTVSRVLPQWRKWEEKYDGLEGIVYYAHQSLKRHRPFQEFFRKRKIESYIDEGSLGYLDGWACFPVRSSNLSIVDVVVRSVKNNSDIRYVVHPGMDSSRPLYCPDWRLVEKSSVVYVVYGIIDSISLYLAGLPTVTGVTGKSLSPELLLPLHKRFIIVPDDGEDREAHKLANSLGWKARVKKIDYSQFENEKIKDPDSICRYFGNQALLQLLA